jgi:hypothetical protein
MSTLPVGLPGDSSQRFYIFLNQFVQKVRSMKPNDVLVFSGGWAGVSEAPVPTCNDEARELSQSKQRGRTRSHSHADTSSSQFHMVMHVLVRKERTFSLTVVNVGGAPWDASKSDGLDYHPTVFDQVSGKVKRVVGVVIEEIPVPRLSDSSFWFMLFRMQLSRGQYSQSATLYETLLPHLNTRPLYANPCFKPAIQHDEVGSKCGGLIVLNVLGVLV